MEEVDFGIGGQPDSRLQRQGSLAGESSFPDARMSDDRRGDQVTRSGCWLTQLYNVSPSHCDY